MQMVKRDVKSLYQNLLRWSLKPRSNKKIRRKSKKLEFTPLEFETPALMRKFYIFLLLEFTPLEFETLWRINAIKTNFDQNLLRWSLKLFIWSANKIDIKRLEFTPLEFETFGCEQRIKQRTNQNLLRQSLKHR